MTIPMEWQKLKLASGWMADTKVQEKNALKFLFGVKFLNVCSVKC